MSPARQPMPDVIVVIPGILGSVLEVAGKQVWGMSGQAIIGNLLSLGRHVQRLALPDGVADEDPGDGVTATALMPDLHLLPGFWTIDGYDMLLAFLRSRFTLAEPTPDQPGNLIPFPYDWRLSNVASARRLAQRVVPQLERWRTHTKNPQARLVLVCHSMGGLVARWFLEVFGGREVTRTLVTIGTPYQGSVNALETLVNGFSKGLGPLRFDLTQLCRSLPSLYQLLPTYPCLDLGDGELRSLADAAVPHVAAHRVAAAAAFHKTIAERVTAQERAYDIIAIKGVLQQTSQSALLAGDRIEPRTEHKGVDHGGDGTVPRPSSHPPEWPSESGAIFAAQKHASLQNTDSVLHQLFGALTGQLGAWMGGVRVGAEVPELVQAGSPVPLQVVAEGEDATLALQAVARREDGTDAGPPLLLRNEGRGRYTGQLAGLGPGCYRITIESAVPQRPVDPVTNITLVWDPRTS